MKFCVVSSELALVDQCRLILEETAGEEWELIESAHYSEAPDADAYICDFAGDSDLQPQLSEMVSRSLFVVELGQLDRLRQALGTLRASIALKPVQPAALRPFLEHALRQHLAAGEQCMTSGGPAHDDDRYNLVESVLHANLKLQEYDQARTNFVARVHSAPTPSLNVVHAIKRGAADFLTEPVRHEDLDVAIQEAVGVRINPVSIPGSEIVRPSVEPFEASSSWTKKLDLFLNLVGSSEVPVLLQGETGVGKEVLAHRLHASSPRSEKPFLKLNCAALPAELIESELFGYDRGAFTGAFRNNPGKFVLAHGGTILLDEIGDMDFKLQAKLLQVLQDGNFLRLGSKEACRVDVRVIAATHCDLELAISEGRFREDLYYRLNVIRIEVPPLRDRKDELLPLAQFFLSKYTTADTVPPEITPSLRQALWAYDWPGNIRELENVMRRYVVMRHPEIIVEELERITARRKTLAARSAWSDRGEDRNRPLPLEGIVYPKPEDSSSHAEDADRQNRVPQISVLGRVDQARKQAELDAILATLNANQWNRKKVAALLNVDYKALLYKMKKLGIVDRQERAPAAGATGDRRRPYSRANRDSSKQTGRTHSGLL